MTPAADLQRHSNRKHKAGAVIGLAGRDQKEGLLGEKSRKRGIPRDEGIRKHRQRHRHTREHTHTQRLFLQMLKLPSVERSQLVQ